MKLENENDEEDLERAGQAVCIYEIYSGPGAWSFLHHGSMFRGLSLVSFFHPKLSADIFLFVLFCLTFLCYYLLCHSFENASKILVHQSCTLARSSVLNVKHV